MPKVSVILPTYNRESSVERALRSAQVQSFPDIEILVCDDASTDATCEIVKRHAEKDPRIKLFRAEKNAGAGAARNIGLRNAVGQFIAFLDSDDEWMPDKLEKQVAALEVAPESVGVCFCGAKIIKNGDETQPVMYKPSKNWERDSFRKFIDGEIDFLTPTIVIKKSCLERTGLMKAEMRRNQDGEFLFRLFSEFDLIVVPQNLAVIHLVVSRSKTVFDALQKALPHWLSHKEMVMKRFGVLTTRRFCATLYRNLMIAALDEGRYYEASRMFLKRFFIYPLGLSGEGRAIAGVLLRKLRFR